MEETTITQELLKQYQKRYGSVTELSRLTSELERMTQLDDRVSLQLILNMRAEELEKVQECKGAIELLEASMKDGERQYLVRMLNGEPEYPPRNWEEEKLVQMEQAIKNTRDRMIEVDRRVSQKLAGKDSYYNSPK